MPLEEREQRSGGRSGQKLHGSGGVICVGLGIQPTREFRLCKHGYGRWAAGVEMKALGPEGKSARIDDSMRAGQVI